MAPVSVLIVEDDGAVRGVFVDALRLEGFSVKAVPQAADAFAALQECRPDVIVLDLSMPPGTLQGLELLAQLRETRTWRDIPVIILSGFGDIVNSDVTRRLRVASVLAKPLAIEELTDTIRRIRP
jgi:DNA-binding response OmpR family regulator